MNRVEWPSLARALAWILAAAFVLATIAFAIFQFIPIGTPPGPIEDFLERVIADFEYLQGIWPIEFAGSALFAIGFLALAGLGTVLGRLADADDGRRGIVVATFLLAGGLGAASQLLWIGARPIATNPQYCECGLLAEEIMARLMILDVASGIQTWLVIGAILTVSVGVVIAGTLGREAGMPAGWLWLSLGIATLAVISTLLTIFRPGPSPEPPFPLDAIVTILLAGILVPIWALWLAARARAIWPTPEPEIEVVET